VVRPLRIAEPGVIYHLTNRGVKRMAIFHDDQDRLDFFRLLNVTRERYPFILHAYCLMSNHYHLLLQPLKHSLSRIMQYVNSRYARRFNRRQGHSGHAFQSRFHSLPVQTDAYLTTVSRYIHLNPYRAGMVDKAEHHRWSNYHALITGQSDPWCDPSFVLGYFGKEVGQQREAYRRFVEDGMTRAEPITQRVLLRMTSWGKLHLG
jgi:putative transposase